MLNKTDFQILEFCSTNYSFFSASIISKGIGLHVTTVSDRMDDLYNKGYLVRKKSGKGFAYKYNFNADHARKFRMFIDADFLVSLGIKQVNKFLNERLIDDNIICCLLYGSSLSTKKYNDIDLLIVYEREKIEAPHIFDAFQMDRKTFRNLYSIGEPRLQAAICTGKILIERGFIFDYFENDLPIKTSQDLMHEIRKKTQLYKKSIENMVKPRKEDLREKITELLYMIAVEGFVSKKMIVPQKAEFEKKLSAINPELKKLASKVRSAKSAKNLWNIFYSEIQDI